MILKMGFCSGINFSGLVFDAGGHRQGKENLLYCVCPLLSQRKVELFRAKNRERCGADSFRNGLCYFLTAPGWCRLIGCLIQWE